MPPTAPSPGCLLVAVKTRVIDELLRASSPDSGTACALFHIDGTLLARNPPLNIGKRFPDATVLPHLANAPFGTFADVSAVDGLARQFGFATVPRYPLFIVASKTTADVLAEWHVHVVMLGSGSLVVVGVLLALLLHDNKQRRELATSNLRFKLIADTVEDVFWINDTRYSKTIYVSPAYERIWGRTCQSLYEDPPSLFRAVHRDDRDNARQVTEVARAAGEPYRIEYRLVQEDGSIRWISSKGSPVKDERGKVIAYAGIASDITDIITAQKRIDHLTQLNQRIIGDSPVGIAVYDIKGPCIVANEALATTIGATVEMVQSLNFREISSWRETGLLNAADEVIATGQAIRREMNAISSFGKTFAVEATLSVFWVGKQMHLLLLMQDMSELRRAQDELLRINRELEAEVEERTAEIRLSATVIEHTGEGAVVTDSDAVILSVNPAFSRITGYSPEDAIGKKTNLLRSGRHDDDFYRDLWESLLAKGSWEGEIWNRRKDGDIYLERLTINAVRNEEGLTTRYVSVFNDVTEARGKDDRIRHMAFHDALTGLPNRLLLEDRLARAIEVAHRKNRQLGLLFIDLDHFKEVNDTFGHKIGDALLVEVAARITACIRGGDTLARLGGDEFVVLCEDVERSEYYSLVAKKIIEAVSSPIIIQSHTTHVGASLGIAVYPDDGLESTGLMKAADTAMYAAKQAGRGVSCFFQAKMSEEVAARMKMDTCLRQALSNREFTLHYQPKVEAGSQETYGYEALLRWNSPELGMVSPEDFIPLAESTRLIVDIGAWVIDEACRQIAAWQLAGFGLKQVAVNVSAHQMKSVKLAEQFSEACRRHGIPTAAMEAELTESVVMADPHKTAAILQELREIGVRLAIDDFGTGYSSLAYLRRLPFDVLKIDRSFVMNADKEEGEAQIVRTILALGKALKLEVIAEGVETEAQAALLREAGCDVFQGYLFSRPLPASDIERGFREEAESAVKQMRRALIVEDSEPMRHLIQLVLEASGPTEIVTAENGAEAISILQVSGADIVFMDWKMNIMDGLECTRRIRAGIDGVDPQIPIVLVTGMASKNAEEEAEAAGVTLFMRKPFSLKQLQSGMEKVLGRA